MGGVLTDGSHGMSSTQKRSPGDVAVKACATASASGLGKGYELTGAPS